MNKYIFIYVIDGKEGFEFIDADAATIYFAIPKFIKDNPKITKLITVDINQTYKVPIELYK